MFENNMDVWASLQHDHHVPNIEVKIHEKLE